MAFSYSSFVSGGLGKQLASSLGLPQPSRLRRHDPKKSLIPGAVLVAGHRVSRRFRRQPQHVCRKHRGGRCAGRR